MQRVRIKSLGIVVIILLTLVFVGCTNRKHPLSTPIELEINVQQQRIYWKQVEGATGYIVDIGSKKYKVRVNSFDMSLLSDGDYDFRVKAISRTFKESSYSNTLRVTISKSSLLKFINTNSVKEYQLVGIGRNTDKIFNIPSEHNGIPITSIGDNAFENNQRIKEVTVGENIKKIGVAAFRSASNLIKVTCNEKLGSIGESAFEDCKSLREVHISSSVSEISKKAFKGCTSLQSVNLPDGLSEIAESVFENSGIDEIRVPNSVNVIKEYAFARTDKLKNLELGENVQKISDYSFYETGELREFIANTKLEEIGMSAFEKSKSLSKLVLNNSLKNIRQNAFKECTNLLEANTPESIEQIEKDAFKETAILNNQSGLAYVDKWVIGTTNSDITEVLPKEETLGLSDYAFFDNKKIKKFVTPSTLKYLGSSCFEECSELNNVSITRANRIGDRVFKNCVALNVGTLPSELEGIGEDAFLNTLNYKNSVSTITVGNWLVGHKLKTIANLVVDNSTVGIADFAFKNRDNIRKVTFGNSLKYIGRGVFFANQKLKEVTIPDSIVEVGEYAFAQMAELIKVKLPNNMTEIKNSVFYESTKLTEVDFGSNLKKVGDYAFYRTAIEKLDLPTSVTSIGKAAFYENKRLTEANIEGDLEYIGDYAFYANTNLERVKFGKKLKKIGNYSFYMAHLLKNLKLEEGVEEIGDYAFAETRNLQTVVLPTTMESIGIRSFEKATSLDKIDLGGTSRIGDYAFASCTQLKSVLITKKQKKFGKHIFADAEPTIYMERGVDEKQFDVAWNSGNSVVVSGIESNTIEIQERTIRNYNQYKTIASLQMPNKKLVEYVNSATGDSIDPKEIANVKIGTILELIWE